MNLYQTTHENIARELDRENREKKNVAHNAQHRINGCKSKKCTLPSDNLTPSQKKALNGPVEEYNLKAPMNWKAFKSMPTDLRAEYLRWLRANFAPSDAMLAEMFEVSSVSAMYARRELGIEPYEKGYIPSAGTREAWKSFIHGAEAEQEESESVATETVVVEEDAPGSAKEVSSEKPTGKSTPDRRLKSFNVVFEDVRSWEELYALLKTFPNPIEGSTLNISVQNERE